MNWQKESRKISAAFDMEIESVILHGHNAQIDLKNPEGGSTFRLWYYPDTGWETWWLLKPSHYLAARFICGDAYAEKRKIPHPSFHEILDFNLEYEARLEAQGIK